MDWFEKLTGLDPDHGNGSYEVAIVLAIIVAIVAATWFYHRVKNGR